jgi:hypothetical protein
VKAVSVDEIAKELNMCQRSAYRYLEAATLWLPVSEVEQKPKRYRLIK